MTVLDASALLAFLNDEPGREQVGRELSAATCMVSAANWSEVWQKALQHELPTAALEALAQLISIVDVNRSHAEQAASLWQHDQHLSLADRLCLALAIERDEAAITADQAWSTATTATIRLIR